MAVRVTIHDGLQVEMRAGNHRWLADEPLGFGDDTGPSPYQLLLGALGACTAMTVQLYAQRKGWALEEVVLELDTHKIHARDCDDCESEPDARVDIIEVDLDLRGDLSLEQRARLEQIAGRCPVHRTLTSETKIRTRRAVPSSGDHTSEG